MKNSLKSKGRFRIGAIAGLCATLACCLTAGLVSIPAAAMGTGATVNINELFNSATNKFDETNLNALFASLGATDYTSLKNNLNGGNLNATQIAELNSNKDIKVTFAGKSWTVTYVSQTRTGEVVATLWAENPTTTTYTFSADGWYSDYHGFTEYYSNQYGSSWIRSSVMNIGSAYLKASDNTGGQKTDEQVVLAAGTQSASNEWARFTMENVEGSVKAFLSTPSEVAWQENLFVPAVNSTHILQSEAYGTPSGGRWYAPSDNTADPRDLRNAPTRIQYSAWANDSIWFPALSETGWNGVTGLWNTTESQRAYSNTTANTWLRSGDNGATFTARYLTPVGGSYGDHVYASFAVRPALHLNLTKAAANSGDTSFDNAALQTAWNSAVQQSLDNGGSQVTFTLPNSWYALPDATYTTSFGDDSGVGFDQGRLYIPSGANIKLDLNGYTIDRALTSELAEGQVILVNGELEICDNSANQYGKITGGNATNGSAVTVVNAKFTLTSGNISGNKAANGGTIRMDNSDSIISGGIISNNTASYGGGIYAVSGNIDITGGIISNNTASYGGGVYLRDTIVANISGGKISNNTASYGGGIGYGAAAQTDKLVLNFSGGEISNNNGERGGGGIALNQGGNNNEFNMTGGKIIHNYSAAAGGLRIYADENSSYVINITGGEISYNESTGDAGGIYVGSATTVTSSRLTFNFGGSAVISHNKCGANSAGVRLVETKATFNGGKISDNVSNGYGGGITAINRSILEISDTEISNNTCESYGAGLSISLNSELTFNSGKVNNNTAKTKGGGIFAHSSNITMNGGEISGNNVNSEVTATNGGGGVYISENASKFILNKGSISNNSVLARGGGVYVDSATFELHGGEISGNFTDTHGGGVYVINDGTTSTFKIYGGKIINNTAVGNSGGVHVATSTTSVFEMYGGVMTGNKSGSNGGAMWLNGSPTIRISGGQIYGNTDNGTESNIYLHATTVKLNITGALSSTGKTTYIGISMNTAGAFTTAYGTTNGGYDPATYFFSDNSAYRIGLSSGEVALVTRSSLLTSLIWQYSTDGTNWINIDSPYASVTYSGAITSYQVRALNGTNTVAFTSKPSGTIKNVGVYAFVINNSNNTYANPTLSFEILPVELIWQYSTDNGNTWFNLTENTIDYTGLTYKIRAWDGTSAVALSTQPSTAIKDANTYSFVANNAGGAYSNETLDFKINVLRLSVEWQFKGAATDARGNYFWNYDGNAHAPVAVLKGLSNEQAGNMPLGYAFTLRGASAGIDPLNIKGAGAYGVTVELLDASGNTLNDPNIILSGASATFSIKPRTVTLRWFDEDGKAVDEAEYSFNGQGRTVTAALGGLLPQDSVTPDISYVKVGGTLSGLPTNKGIYTASAKLPANCYNYVLDKQYTCQINISSVEISVGWTGNADNGKFEWEFYGDSANRLPAPSLNNPVAGATVPFSMEYAPVDASGTVGTYTATAPVNAGKYMARVKITDTEGNYTLSGETQAFEITKLGVTVVWADSSTGNPLTVDADGYIQWEYDGQPHNIKPIIDNVQVLKDGVLGASLAVVRSDGNAALTNVSSATATAQLDSSDAFNANFVIKENVNQIYKVYKKVLTSATWTDGKGDSYVTGDLPRYNHGEITGVNGPAFTVTAAGAGGVTLTLQTPSYSQSFAGDWVVDETNGYKATARLSSADSVNYEFADGANETTITFFIRSVSGEKENITVTWVVFTGANTYVKLSDYGDFTYNGTQQFPRALYVKTDGSYEELAMSNTGKGTDAGTYTVRLLPNSKYNISAADFTCRYNIKPVDVTISWQDGAMSGAQTFSYIYNGAEQKPHAVVSGNGSLPCPVTVNGETNAGTYTATAEVSKNFNITSGATQSYTIKKLQINANLVQWDYASDNALTFPAGGSYWIYDGNVHGPKAYVVLSQLGNLRIDFLVTGLSSAIGVHNVYAVLDSSDPAHANFDISGTASSSFEIVRVPVTDVYWEDGAGNTSQNGSTLLSFVYDGNPHAPTAYYLDTDGVTKIPLNIAGAMTAAGKYVAYVTDSFDYGGTIPQCNFEITAVEVTVVWSDTSKTYNGLTQYPTATLEDGSNNAFVGVNGLPLVLGTDYVITGFANAGTYTAEIRFTNTNYTFAGNTNKTAFVISTVDISNLVTSSDWSADASATTNAGGLYSWVYNEQSHAPTLTLTTYTLDGDAVVITFAYSGVTETVGTHTVTARIASAMWRGSDISANLVFSADIQYEITPFEVTLVWDFAGEGATEDTVKNIWYWTYDKASHAPKVTYTDWNGATKTLTVYGGETNARPAAYTARVDAPENCVFAANETGTRSFEIRQASIVVEWRAPDADGTDTSGNFYWNYDGNAHAPEAYVQGTNDKLAVTGAAVNAGANYTATAAQGDSNYIITSGATCVFSIKAQEVYLKWYGKDGSETNFVWQYDGKNHAPTAVLADASGNVINGADNKPISVSITGATANVGKNHTAQAVDTFPNYDFHSSVTLTHTFEIEARNLADFGFVWRAPDAVKTNDGTYDVYTYEYSGGAVAPVPYTQNNIQFDTVIYTYAGGVKGQRVGAITEIGEYIITITPKNPNYAVPAGLDTVRVTVTARTVKVVWSTDSLVYNGSAQAPAAQYTDVDGNVIILSVSGAMTDAGKNYTATASFVGTAPKNYVLDTSTLTKTFDIAKLEIPVSWQWSTEWANKRVTYDGQNHTPVPVIDTSVILSADVTKLAFAYEITKTGMAAVVNGTVKDAGAYKITLKISGAAAANYAFESGKEEETFTIAKKTLTITADDMSVNYGDNAPAYTATFAGFVPSEEAQLKADLAAVQSSWLRCPYINRSAPGTYTIGLVYNELSRLLPNYDVITQDGTLTVNPAQGTVIWTGDNNDLSAYYDGAEYKPFAFYYDINDTLMNNPITLNVVYATYSNGVYTEIANPTAAINAGTYYVIAKSPNANIQLSNAEISYEILKREITVEIESKQSVYGSPYKTLTYNFANGSLQPLLGDDLQITLTCDVQDSSKYVNGFMNAGKYDIVGSWDSADFGANYNVVFTGEKTDSLGNNSLGVYEITKAEIKITKQNEAYSNEEFTSIQNLDTQSQGVQIKLGDTFADENGVMQYRYIQYAGYQNATTVTVHYSRVHNIGSIEDGLLTPPDPHDMTPGVNNYQTYRERIRNVGCYAVNYYIEIPNHETLYGTWTVLMLPESQVVRVEFVKDFQVEYGKPVPENLAAELLKGGYININIPEERFLQYATATVADGRGGYISSTTNAGKYTIEIEIQNTDSNTQLLVTYHGFDPNNPTQEIEDTNINRYVITPKLLTVDWGELEFDHDGTVKLPAPNVYGFVTADTLVLENIKTRASGTEYEYTAYTVVDNGTAVTIIVAARGNFTDVGGHTLIVSVENGNYTVDMLNSNATVSIKGDTQIVEGGLPDWLLWVIIAAAVVLVILIIVIIVVVKKKRAMAEDDDGFYDNVE